MRKVQFQESQSAVETPFLKDIHKISYSRTQSRSNNLKGDQVSDPLDSFRKPPRKMIGSYNSPWGHTKQQRKFGGAHFGMKMQALPSAIWSSSSSLLVRGPIPFYQLDSTSTGTALGQTISQVGTQPHPAAGWLSSDPMSPQLPRTKSCLSESSGFIYGSQQDSTSLQALALSTSSQIPGPRQLQLHSLPTTSRLASVSRCLGYLPTLLFSKLELALGHHGTLTRHPGMQSHPLVGQHQLQETLDPTDSNGRNGAHS